MILGRVFWNPRVIKYNHNTKIEVNERKMKGNYTRYTR